MNNFENFFNNELSSLVIYLIAIVLILNTIFIIFLIFRNKPVKFSYGMVYDNSNSYIGCIKRMSSNLFKMYDKSDKAIYILQYKPENKSLENKNTLNSCIVVNLKGEKIGYYNPISILNWEIFDLNNNKIARIDW